MRAEEDMRPPLQVSSPLGLKVAALVMAFGLAFYFLAPPSLWQHAIGAPSISSTGADECPACVCECADRKLILPPGVVNVASSDCEKLDKEHLDKNSIDLLSEELRLQEKVSEESQVQADSALLDAKKLASQYQKEAEKCNSGMETCEKAREKSEAALTEVMKVSAMWERRARELGWRERVERQSIFSRMGLSSASSEDEEGNSFLRSRK